MQSVKDWNPIKEQNFTNSKSLATHCCLNCFNIEHILLGQICPNDDDVSDQGNPEFVNSYLVL